VFEVVDDEMTEWNEGVLVRMSRRGKEFVPQVYLSQDAEGRLGCALQDRYRVMPPVVKVKLYKKEVDAVEALTDMKRLAVEMQWTGNSGETKESIRSKLQLHPPPSCRASPLPLVALLCTYLAAHIPAFPQRPD
jgi:hypothetical protein